MHSQIYLHTEISIFFAFWFLNKNRSEEKKKREIHQENKSMFTARTACNQFHWFGHFLYVIFFFFFLIIIPPLRFVPWFLDAEEYCRRLLFIPWHNVLDQNQTDRTIAHLYVFVCVCSYLRRDPSKVKRVFFYFSWPHV